VGAPKINIHMKEQLYWNFPNVGFLGVTLDPQELAVTIKEMNDIQSNFSDAKIIPLGHAGNLKQEYHLKNCLSELESILQPMCQQYLKTFDFDRPGERSFKLKTAWINFQKKHEFFQNHTHSGVFSFALWLKVPFLIKDEIAFCSPTDREIQTTATFNFHYTDALGRIKTYTIPVDNTFENKMIVFPGNMTHSVNPFYTSDDYRVCVSGNIDYS